MRPSGSSSEEWRALQPWVDLPVPAPPAPFGDSLEQRVRGMLMGLAIGDALGNTSEGRAPADRRRRYGEIRDYLPNWWADWAAVGVPSDDTQLAFWTVESLLRQGCLDPADLAAGFAGSRIFGIGKSVTAFLLAYRGEGAPWYRAGRPSAGNGALMRIAPVLLPHLRPGSAVTLWRDVIAATVLTHRDEAAVAASVGMVGVLAECMALVPSASVATPVSAPAPEWWPRTFLRYARAVETGAVYQARWPGGEFSGSLCDLVEQRVLPAVAAGANLLDADADARSGAYLLETVPAVLLILARHGGDPEETIVRAVNDTWDNDTIGAVVGAAVGALHGVDALPKRWRDRLLGRTREADDGRVQALIDRAVEVFLSGGC